MTISLSFLLLCLLSSLHLSHIYAYTAAIAQHSIATNGSSDPITIKNVNLQHLSALASAAAQKQADIILFPEFALLPSSALLTRSACLPYTEQAPDINDDYVPCLNTSLPESSPAVYMASCMAMENNLYVMINIMEYEPCSSSSSSSSYSSASTASYASTSSSSASYADEASHAKEVSACPSDGFYIFVTDLLFAPNGTLVSKYRKTHPFYIETVNPNPSSELITYTTEFGVTYVYIHVAVMLCDRFAHVSAMHICHVCLYSFGFFICFDIAFHDPAIDLVNSGIKHFAYAAAIGEIGSDTVARAWSFLNHATVLLANLGSNDSKIFIEGSEVEHDVINVDGTDGDSIYIAEVPA